jgi:hypothetical protein
MNKEYQVMTSENLHVLEGYVNDAFKIGWELVGGLAIHVENSPEGRVTIFHQAMMRQLDDKGNITAF